MKSILAVLVFILGVTLAGYTGGWLLFIKPIIDCCKALDAGTLTALMVGVTVVKCIFASMVAGIIMWVSTVVAALLNR